MPGLLFRGYERPDAHKLATAGTLHGRLVGALKLEAAVAPLDGAPPAGAFRALDFAFAGPRDVAALQPGTVVLVSPAPGATAAEVAYCPYAVLVEPDLPWRYTLATPSGRALKPWLVLVVGTPEEVRQNRDGTVRLGPAVTNAHDLASSELWAHSQRATDDDPATEGVDERWPVSRLLSLRQLDKDQDYVAAIVPAYADDGGLAWARGAEATVRAFYVWRFRTAQEGETFEQLAGRLRQLHEPPALGINRLAYPLPGVEKAPVEDARGALTRGTDGPLANAKIATHLRKLRQPEVVEGRRVVGLPHYGAAWGAETSAWAATLGEDPRHRAAAGLGQLAGVTMQEEIVAAARDRFGAVPVAVQRIAALVAGLEAGGGLWRRRLPKDAAHRLLVFGPGLGRVATKIDDTVFTALQVVTSDDVGRPLPPAFFSSAARRVLRPGTARARLAKPGALKPAALVAAANRCPPAEAHPGGLPTGDDEFVHMLELVASGQLDVREESMLWARELLGLEEQRPPCSPLDVSTVVGALSHAYDPRGKNASARVRVLATIDGFDDSQPTAPVELCPDLDLPAWRFLRDHERNWLLPGVELMPPDTVAAVVTNPRFADAFLVGLNTQALAELSWRGLPVAVGCTPMRRFWDYVHTDAKIHVDPNAPDPSPIGPYDIRGVKRWTNGSALGQRASLSQGKAAWDASHSDVPGENLVIVFRTPIFRRFPHTLAYLWAHDDKGKPVDAGGARVWPTFQGSLGPDRTFFGFPVEWNALKTHYVVLEEVPDGYRFERARAAGADGGAIAASAFADPVRVLISGDWLLPEERHG